MNRFRKIKIVLYLTGIFLAGIVTGVFISLQVVRHMLPNQANMTEHWSRDLQRTLDLSPEQMGKIKPFVQNAVSGFRANVAADALSALSNCNAQILIDLTPEQKTRFEPLEKRQREFILHAFGAQAAPKPDASAPN